MSKIKKIGAFLIVLSMITGHSIALSEETDAAPVQEAPVFVGIEDSGDDGASRPREEHQAPADSGGEQTQPSRSASYEIRFAVGKKVRSMTLSAGEILQEPVDKPTRRGYDFLWWYDASGPKDEPFLFGTSVGRDLTLKALFRQVQSSDAVRIDNAPAAQQWPTIEQPSPEQPSPEQPVATNPEPAQEPRDGGNNAWIEALDARNAQDAPEQPADDAGSVAMDGGDAEDAQPATNAWIEALDSMNASNDAELPPEVIDTETPVELVVEIDEGIFEEPTEADARSVRIESNLSGGPVFIGDQVDMTARLSGFDGVAYQLQWQTNDGSSWRDLPHETGMYFTLKVDEQNRHSAYRVAVTVVEG